MRKKRTSASVFSFLSRSLNLAGNQYMGTGNLAVVAKERDFRGSRVEEKPSVVHESKTVQVSIERRPEDVYAFVANPLTLSSWATAFCKSVRQSSDAWLIGTSDGEMELRFCDENAFGVLDHFVKGENGVEVFAPMRVVANGEGSEVMLTVFRRPGMTEERFITDCSWVLRDLLTLKQLMENTLMPRVGGPQG